MTAAESASPFVFVVDDDPEVRAAIELLMRSVRLNTRSFESAAEFLAEWKPNEPGCLVLDVRMPGMSGLELQSLLNERGAAIPIVFLSGHGDIPMALRAVRAGAVDFLEKPFKDQALIDAIHAALAQDSKQRSQKAGRESLKSLIDSLSPREAQVGHLIADGLSSPEIAKKLRLSPRTVEMHRARLMKRLGVSGIADVTRIMLEGRSLSAPPEPAAPEFEGPRRGRRPSA